MNSKFANTPHIIISDNKTNKKTSDEVKKPFCKVCHDAKQPGYNTHYLRSGDNVVCPYLLSLECTYCHHTGHTVKYCSVLKKNQDKISNGLPPRSKNRIYNETTSDGWTVRARTPVPGKFLIIGLEDESKKKSDNLRTDKNPYVVLHSKTEQETIEAAIPPMAQDFPALSTQVSISEPIVTNSRSWASVAATSNLKAKKTN